MATRLDLHNALLELGFENVYFQPPQSIKMKYPCLVYSLNPGRFNRADDAVYLHINQYTLTFIHSDPDDPRTEMLVNAFTYMSFNRRFVNDNLYHDAFTLYY